MKKIAIITAVFLMFSASINTVQAALDVNAAFQLLSAELQKKGAAPSDVNAAAQPMKTLLGLGANTSDVKTIVMGLIQSGFKGKDLSSLTGMVGDLTKTGVPPKTASSVVSQAIQQASASGLKGSALISKVQTVVDQKKTQLAAIKADADKVKKGLGSLFGH